MQADTAVAEDILTDTYSFSELNDSANVLIFSNPEFGNIGYKLLQLLGGAEAIGVMFVGMDKPVHVLQRGDEEGRRESGRGCDGRRAGIEAGPSSSFIRRHLARRYALLLRNIILRVF